MVEESLTTMKEIKLSIRINMILNIQDIIKPDQYESDFVEGCYLSEALRMKVSSSGPR
jgi:hypothetical protein